MVTEDNAKTQQLPTIVGRPNKRRKFQIGTRTFIYLFFYLFIHFIHIYSFYFFLFCSFYLFLEFSMQHYNSKKSREHNTI